MATPAIRPPFSWLGRYTALVSVVSVTGIGAFFRFFELNSLPPGLYDSSARIGLQALALLEHGALPGLNATNGYAPLWVMLTALSVKVLGHTELALRIWPALLGTLAVLTTWLWARSWFSLRIAWLSSFLVAVTPWAVTLSRNGIEAAPFPLLVTLTLWLATRAYLKRQAGRYVWLALAVVLDLLSGPVGWLLALVVCGAGVVQLWHKHQLTVVNRERLIGGGVLAVGLAGLGYLAGISLGSLSTLTQTAGLSSGLGMLGGNIIKTLLMFNVFGDENYRHNLSGEPLLNVFVGLMLVAGLLVAISRLHQRRYRLLLAFVVVLLIPAAATSVGVPNAARAAAAIPLVLTLCAVGISYMLELWYATFPINSAARATGQSAVIVLLALTFFQGYTQYFRAWAGSSQVYVAYNEGAVQIAAHLPEDRFSGQRYVVAPSDQLPVVAYLSHNGPAYQPLDVTQIAGLPVAAINRQFWIAAANHDAAAKVLKQKFPGGVLLPHYSSFNLAEIYYTYEVAK